MVNETQKGYARLDTTKGVSFILDQDLFDKSIEGGLIW